MTSNWVKQLKMFATFRVLVVLFLAASALLFPIQQASASMPEPGGATTVVNPSGEGAVSVNEDAPEPETDNIRLVVPNLLDPEGSTPSSIRIISVDGGTLKQGGSGAAISLGLDGTVLSLSSNRINLRFKPNSNRDTNASFTYVIVDPHDSSVNSIASTATIPITAVNDTPILQTSVGGNGTGLAATYYLTEWDLTGSTLSRIDSTINFSNNFGVAGINAEQFSVRWTGKVKSPITGNVTFSTQSDDGIRLWVNGTQIIDNWTLHGTTTDTSSPVAMVAGEMYDIRMEFYERGGGEVAILQWAYSGQGTQVIPQAYLYPATVRPSLKFINGSSAVVIDDAITIEDVDNTTMTSATAEISANFQSDEDSLQFTDQNGITGNYEDGVLTLTGTASLAHYQSALRSIKYLNSAETPTATTRTVRFRVYDGSANSSYVTRDIEFAGENTAPVITQGTSTSVTMDEDGSPTPFSLTLDATDADEHSITWSISSTASHGTASVGEPGNSVAVSYIPTSDYYGSDSFIVQASDGQGGLDTITINITIRDGTPPIISDISATTPSSTSATIIWTTDEQSSTKVSYGLTDSYGLNTSETDTTSRVTSHSKTITGLLSCTKYHYKVTSTDAATNTTHSSDGTFTTPGCPAEATPNTIVTDTIDSANGGSVESTSDGSTITVEFPEDFTSDDDSVVIQIKALPKGSVLESIGRPANLPREVGAVVFDVKAIINGSTILESFNAPVKITYQYSVEDVAGLDSSTMWLYHFTGGEWRALDACALNLSTNTISCTAPSFSVFALFAQPISTSKSNASNSNTTSDPDSSCSDVKPPHAPDLFQISSSPTTATLYFVPVSTQSDYIVLYGTTSDTNNHGTSFTVPHTNGVASYTIKDLLPNTKYYYKIQAKHGCMPGDWSEIVSSATTSSAGGTTSPHGFISQLKSRGNLEIVETQQEYSPQAEVASESAKEKSTGYDVVIKVKNQGSPVAGATVELHSTPRKTVTDKDGIARFTDVEGGDHTVYLAYNDYTGEEKIKVEGEDKNVDISISVTLARNQFVLSPQILAIIGLLSLIIIILFALLVKKRKKEDKESSERKY